MRRRKWWIIALSLSLLAGCVGVWKWSERPPFSFMNGATLVFTSPSRTANGEVHLIYALTRPFPEVAASAEREAIRSRWEPGRADLYTWDLPQEGAISRVAVFGWDNETLRESNNTFPWAMPPLPDDTATTVEVDRKPTPLDRVRLWLSQLRWKAARR